MKMTHGEREVEVNATETRLPDPVNLFALAMLLALLDETDSETLGELVPGEHSHTCACGNCWSHANKVQFDPRITDEQFTALHTCSRCGNEVRMKDKA